MHVQKQILDERDDAGNVARRILQKSVESAGIGHAAGPGVELCDVRCERHDSTYQDQAIIGM
jgi:hypothetical protein